MNLRASPSLSSETLLTVPKGAKLPVLKRSGSWYGVPLPLEASVYIAKVFLRWEGPLITGRATKGSVQGQRVHVRAGPGTAFTSLGFLENGQTIFVRQLVGEWALVQPPDFCRGWIASAYVTFLETLEIPEPTHGNP